MDTGNTVITSTTIIWTIVTNIQVLALNVKAIGFE